MTFVIKQSPRKPPQTKAESFQWLKLRTAVVDIDIKVEVLPDGQVGDESKAKKAVTTYKAVGSIGPDGAFRRGPRYSFQRQGRLDVVVGITKRAEVKGVLRIQTSYGPGSSPEAISVYGRGTTPQDQFAGNVTLGFHESCHRQDYLNYLRTAPFPQFRGKVGMSKEDFEAAYLRFDKAVLDYFTTMSEISHRITDETGHKKSTFKAKGQRPKPLTPAR